MTKNTETKELKAISALTKWILGGAGTIVSGLLTYASITTFSYGYTINEQNNKINAMKERLAESEILVNKQVECTMELREQSIRLDMRVTDNDEDLQEYRAIISDFKKEVRTGFDKLEYKIDNYSRANNTEIKRLRTYNDSLSYE
jgi:hypothetical protein